MAQGAAPGHGGRIIGPVTGPSSTAPDPAPHAVSGDLGDVDRGRRRHPAMTAGARRPGTGPVGAAREWLA